MAAGLYHSLALKKDGSVVAWGNGEAGQTTVPVSAQSGVMAIAAGEYHSVALKTGGSVVAWGTNAHGQTTIPVAAQSGVTAIAAGSLHTVAIVPTVLVATPVTLNARAVANELLLTWPATATGFTLESTLDLTPSPTWSDVTNPPVVLGAEWTVTNAFSGAGKFYRLRKP